MLLMKQENSDQKKRFVSIHFFLGNLFNFNDDLGNLSNIKSVKIVIFIDFSD